MTETRALKNSSSAYKKYTNDLVAASKKLQPIGGKEEELEVLRLKKKKQAIGSSKGPTMVRVAKQAMIPIGIAIKEKAVRLLEVTLATHLHLLLPFRLQWPINLELLSRLEQRGRTSTRKKIS